MTLDELKEITESRFTWPERHSRPLRAALRSVRTWTPSSAASASRDHSRAGSSRAARARALANHGSGVARRPESHVRYVSAATPNRAANSGWDRCSASRSARISHGGPGGAVRGIGARHHHIARFPRKEPVSVSLSPPPCRCPSLPLAQTATIDFTPCHRHRPPASVGVGLGVLQSANLGR